MKVIPITDYEKLLERAYEKLPPIALSKKRFEPPSFISEIQGKKTIIKNFGEVSSTLNRDPNHLLKFISRELATAGNIEGQRCILQGKFLGKSINKKLEEYLNEFILCKECGKPDTKLVTIDRIKQVKCEACGATFPVRNLK